MEYRVRFTGLQQVDLEQFTVSDVTAGSIKAQSIYSLMSTGTENTIYNRAFAPDTHWDHWVKYPFYPGYATIGRVTEVGPDVTNFRIGDLVAARTPHASAFIEPIDKVYPVPANMDPQLASWFAIGKIAAVGAMRAQYIMGDRVLVIGAGVIGQMSVRWAWAMGAETVIVVDSAAERLTLAERGGATTVIAKPVAEATTEIIAAVGGRKPRVVIDSTGNPRVFADALRIVEDNGTIVLLGDAGSPCEQCLTPDVINRGLHIVGAHDSHHWPDRSSTDVIRLFFQLAGSGRIRLDGMISHRIPAHQAPRAYQIANHHRENTMGILLDWTTKADSAFGEQLQHTA